MGTMATGSSSGGKRLGSVQIQHGQGGIYSQGAGWEGGSVDEKTSIEEMSAARGLLAKLMRQDCC